MRLEIATLQVRVLRVDSQLLCFHCKLWHVAHVLLWYVVVADVGL